MATKNNKKAAADPKSSEEKAAKRKARIEALKNRPAVQRPNSKQIDVIEFGDGTKVMNFGYAIKNKEGHRGVLITSVVCVNDQPTSTSVTFVPGNLMVKSKKGHGVITSPKVKKAGKEEEEGSED